jgi:hypothetical protein
MAACRDSRLPISLARSLFLRARSTDGKAAGFRVLRLTPGPLALLHTSSDDRALHGTLLSICVLLCRDTLSVAYFLSNPAPSQIVVKV